MDLVGHRMDTLDRNIALCFHVIAKLARKRNVLLPIFRLPNKILCLIFEYYVPSVTRIYHSHPRLYEPYQWIIITHVCHHWCEVALNRAQIWTRIWLDSSKPAVDLLQMFVTRSMQLPLQLSARNVISWEHVDQFRCILPHLSRVKKLTLEASSASYFALQFGFPASMPLLHTFDLHVRQDTQPAMLPTLPRFVSAHAAPWLSVLELTGVGIDWGMLVLPKTLERFIVRDCAIAGCVSDAVRALKDLPALTHLDLHHALVPDLAGPTLVSLVEATPLSFPSLKVLVLIGLSHACIHFLLHTVQATPVQVEIHFLDTPDITFAPVFASALREIGVFVPGVRSTTTKSQDSRKLLLRDLERLHRSISIRRNYSIAAIFRSP